MLPDHVRADDDGPTCSDEEKGVKRMRSSSTTPRSGKGAGPDECDRVMGVTSVGFREMVRFGEESASGLEADQDGVANNSADLDETQEEVNLCHENDSGAGGSSRGVGSASLAECLDRMGAQLNTTNPATCASGEGYVGRLPSDEPETSTPAPKREEFDVKEEPESPGLREGETTQPSQPSQLPP